MDQEIDNNSRSRELRNIFNNITDGICILDSDGNIIDTNLAMAKISGYSRDQLLGMNVKGLLHPEDHEKSKIYFKLLHEKGSYEGFSGRFLHQSGEIKHFEISSKAIYNQEGTLIGSRDLIRDVTDRKLIEAELVKSEEKFRTIVTNSEAIIFILDTEGVFTLSEGKGLKALGLAPGEVVGASALDLYKDNKAIIKAIKEALRGESSKSIMNLGELYFDTFYSPYLSPEGESLGLIGMAVNITDRIKKEHELEEARKRAEQSDHLKTAFLANISHEIRTPMNAILGFSSLLTNNNTSEQEKKSYLEIIQTKGNELVQLLSDLIDISKIEAGIITMNNSEFSLNKLISEFTSVAKRELIIRDRPGVDIRASMPGKEVVINGDEYKVRQILNNLINNAIKFTSEGYIEFGFTKEPSRICLFVKDSGVGIKESQMDVIFERFRQADDASIHSSGGTGLGLYISKTLINQMGGEIWVRSSPGKGSAFYFTLPC